MESFVRRFIRSSLAWLGVGVLVCATVVGLTTPAGALYMGLALVATAAYVVFAWRFVQQRDRLPARRLFYSSLVVLPVLLSGLIADLVLFG